MEANQALEQTNGELTPTDDREFVKAMRAATKAKALMALHGDGVNESAVDKVIAIARTGKNGDALAAIKLLGQFSGDLKAGHSVEVRLSFEELRRKNESGGRDSLSGLFDIQGELIDAEPEEE